MAHISGIVAADRDFLIGFHSPEHFRMPWEPQKQLRDDMAFFRSTTRKAWVIVGRKTLESIGRFLPGRFHLVFSRQEQLDFCGHTIRQYSQHLKSSLKSRPESWDTPAVLLSNWQDLEAFLKLEVFAAQLAVPKLFCIGGAELFSTAVELQKLNDLYLTVVDAQLKDSIRPDEQPVYLPKNFYDSVQNNWATAQSLQQIHKNEQNEYAAEIYLFRNFHSRNVQARNLQDRNLGAQK